MRPLKLSIDGFTSFRQAQTIDFAGLSLFCITGPTGSGKTSVLDAMCWALYGKVPRVGREIKQLMSFPDGAMKVMFEFAVDAQQYRVTRSTRKSNTKILLEIQKRESQWETAGVGSDRSRQVEAKIEKLIGLSYDGFIRSVILPQGQFAQFLCGDKKERRNLLKDLLGLHIYERMRRRASDIATQAQGRIAGIEYDLSSTYAHATLDRIKQLRREVAETKALLEDAVLREQQLAELEVEYNNTVSLLNQGALLHGRLVALEQQAKQIHQEAAKLDAQEAQAGKEYSQAQTEWGTAPDIARDLEQASNFEKLRTQLDQVGSSQYWKQQAQLAQANLDEANHQLSQAQKADLVGTLTRSLNPGDPCPVCLRPLERLVDHPPHMDTKQAERALKDRTREMSEARDPLSKALNLEELMADVPNQPVASKELSRRLAKLRELENELNQASTKRREYDQKRARSSAEIDAAQDQAARLINTEAPIDHADLQEALAIAAKRKGWLEEKAGGPVAQQRKQARGEMLERKGALAQADSAAQQAQKDLERRRVLEQELKELKNQRQIHQQLARELQDDHFVEFIQGEALRNLAKAGGEKLQTLSDGRYLLSWRDEEFVVADSWSEDRERSVATLSGGETFLASLALALALAEQIAALATEPTARLDSLFLDEGFGTLDSEAIQTVVSAIEKLGTNGRVVGVVTHVPELADSLPYRLHIEKAPGGKGGSGGSRLVMVD